MSHARVLLVDDDDAVRFSLGNILALHGFEVSSAANVIDALRLIGSHTFDVLLSDLHMPGPGDGLTVVSAMRHSNPKAVTLLLSAFPQMTAAANAILLQTDQILVKPMNVAALLQVIEQRLANGAPPPRVVESVAEILDRTMQGVIDLWYSRVLKDHKLTRITMSEQERCRHLPQLVRDLVSRLRSPRPLGSRELKPNSSAEHGRERYLRGYTAPMMVDESRMLQVSLFETLQNNMLNIDFSILLSEVMTIADEVDSQLSQAMESFLAASEERLVPARS